MTKRKIAGGMVRSLETAMLILDHARNRCDTIEKRQRLNNDLKNLHKLKCCCLFALSDLTFDFDGVFRETERRLLKDIQNG